MIPEHHPAYTEEEQTPVLPIKTSVEEACAKVKANIDKKQASNDWPDKETIDQVFGEIPVDPKKAEGDKKTPMHLIPYDAEAQVARALKEGADKYGPFNWRHNHVKMSTYIGAMRRHIGEWQEGSDQDHKSGEHPLAHVAASCLIVLDAIKHGAVEDDRP